jgi:hypothetical protein
MSYEQPLRPSAVKFHPAGEYGHDRYVDTLWPDQPTLQVIAYNNGNPHVVKEIPLPGPDMYSFKIIYKDEETIGDFYFVDPKQDGERYDVRFPVYVP